MPMKPASAREHGADQKADGGIQSRRAGKGEDEDDHADDGDGGVLAVEIGRRAFTDGG
jgi:hypothetical protein